jgi:hypothetical protein
MVEPARGLLGSSRSALEGLAGAMSDSGRTLPALFCTLFLLLTFTPPNFISGRTLPGLFGGQFARVAWCIMGQKGGFGPEWR